MRGFRDLEVTLHPTSADPVPTEPDGSLPIMFLHLPRTAGTTIKRMLETIFGAPRSLVDLHFYDTSQEDLSRFAMIEGHKRAPFFERAFGHAWVANGLTMVREPVARVVSQARHIRALPHHRDHAALVSEVDDPAALFDQVLMLSNLQTKLLAGKSPRAEHVGADELETAKSLLASLSFGLTESFQLSMCLLAERFALDLPRFGVRGASPERGDDDLRTEEFRAEALVRNDFDAELYRYATDLFQERVERYITALLELPLGEARLDWFLRSQVREVREVVYRRRRAKSAPLRGWVLVDGRPADAVLVRTASGVTPLCCRIASSNASRRTSSVANRNAGVVGRVRLPKGTQSLDVIAIDRTRGLRAERTFEVRRTDDDAKSKREPDPAPASPVSGSVPVV